MGRKYRKGDRTRRLLNLGNELGVVEGEKDGGRGESVTGTEGGT